MSPRRSEDEARGKLREAGRRVLLEHFRNAPERLHDGLRGILTAPAVAAEAGYASHAVVYRVWGAEDVDGGEGDEDRSRAMRAFVLDVAGSMTTAAFDPRVLVEGAVKLRREGAAFVDVVKVLAQVELERLTNSGQDADEWMAWHGLAPYAMGDPLRSRWNESQLEQAFNDLSHFYRTTLTLWDREMRPGLTERHLAVALNSAVDGFVLHHRLVEDVDAPLTWRPAEPETSSEPWTLWSITVMGIVDAMTQPVSRDEARP